MAFLLVDATGAAEATRDCIALIQINADNFKVGNARERWRRSPMPERVDRPSNKQADQGVISCLGPNRFMLALSAYASRRLLA
jgi:hypothetical protein